MKRLAILGGSILLVTTAALAAEPHVTTIPDGVEPAPPSGAPGGGGVPCDYLIRYDDGTDDSPGSGLTLGGPGGINQRIGIVAQAPPADPGGSWQVQSVGFFSQFWLTPGNVNIEVTSVGDPANTTTETIFVSGPGVWETALSDPIVVAPEAEFSLMLCTSGDGTHGVTGEDTSSPDLRSYWSGSSCTTENPDEDEDLMIWACVRYVQGSPLVEVPTLGIAGLAVLGLLLAGLAFWIFSRRKSGSTGLPA